MQNSLQVEFAIAKLTARTLRHEILRNISDDLKSWLRLKHGAKSSDPSEMENNVMERLIHEGGYRVDIGSPEYSLDTVTVSRITEIVNSVGSH